MNSQADFEFLFRTRAELTGARQVEEQLQRDIGKAKALGNDFTELEAKLKRVQGAIAAAGKPAGPSMGDMFGKIREGLGDVIPGFATLDGIISKFAGGAMGAIAGGFTLIASGLSGAKKAIEEFTEAEVHVAKLDAALAQTGNLTDEYREQLQELANQFQKTTGVAEEKWLSVITRLTQFGADPSSINKTVEAVKNLAGLLGGDVETAANLVSRAMQGNYEVFARYGIVVEDAGSETEKFDKLCTQLALRGGGQLEATTKTLSGRFNDLKASTSDVFKAIGRGIADTGVLQTGLEVLGNAAEWYADKLGGAIKRTEGLGNAAITTKQQIDGATPSDSFAKSVERIKKAAQEATEQLEKMRAKLEATKSAEDQIADAEKGQKIAEIDAAVASGKMSKVEAAMRKGVIESDSVKEAAERQKNFLREQDQINAAKLAVADKAETEANKAVLTKQHQMQQSGSDIALAKLKRDQEADEATRKAKAEQLGDLKPAAGVIGTAAYFLQKRKLESEVADLDAIIEKRKPLIEGEVTKRENDKSSLKDLRTAAADATKAASDARTQYEQQHVSIQSQVGAIDRVTGLKLRTIGLETGVRVIGDRTQAEEQARQTSARSAAEQAHGLSGIISQTQPGIVRSGDAVAVALRNLGATIEGSMGSVLKAVQAVTARVSNIETRVNRDQF
jgi:hypothetical protein